MAKCVWVVEGKWHFRSRPWEFLSALRTLEEAKRYSDNMHRLKYEAVRIRKYVYAGSR